ncbi:cold shock domain-containing protein [Paenibacillus faecis]|uniref:Cold shock domain-containing protein n=1 Tax=Paenibacillus faecis TaxID=862114 RepID=A0A5D0CQ57_9BACL|nr:cold shock domain-containing protein [Paenibacillus faecis]
MGTGRRGEHNWPVDENGNKQYGKVKWFDDKKGYGFIENKHGGDIFVHFSEISGNGYKTLTEGQNVRYSIKHNDRGDYAADVQKLEEPKVSEEVSTLLR